MQPMIVNRFPTPALKHQFKFVHGQFLYSFWSITNGLWHPFPLVCAAVHMAVFVVNAALMVSQWQQHHA